MRDLRAFLVPYDSGQRATRMGAGPLRLAEMLPHIESEIIESHLEFRPEAQTSFGLYRKLAERVRAANSFPVVLSGNCGACAATAAGIGVDDLAVLWFDAHGDLMTPETTVSGFLDGMALSIVAGMCWTTLAPTIPHFSPIATDRILHVGGRDFSPREEDAFDEHGVALIRSSEVLSRGVECVAPALDAIATRARRILIHVDVDVLDIRFGAANPYASAGGLSPDDVLRIIGMCGDRFEIAAIDIASYDPACDGGGTIAAAAVSFVNAATAAA